MTPVESWALIAVCAIGLWAFALLLHAAMHGDR